MVNKNFEKITYEDNNGNIKGHFEKFLFASSGSFAPYNLGRGQNLVVTRETKKEKVPHMGFRAALRMEQDKNDTLVNDETEIAFSFPQTRRDQYGLIFCAKFLNTESETAFKAIDADTTLGNTFTDQSIKKIGSINLNGNIYHYFLVKIAPDTQARESVRIEFSFDTSKFGSSKMLLEIFEGFMFDNFSNHDYNIANLTTHLSYLHQKDFDKNKFQDIMVGDVLLAGMKQPDGTVIANDSLRLTLHNIINTIPHRMTFIFPYISPENAKTLNNGWCRFKPGVSGYPAPILPCQGTGQIVITLLTHSFDTDNTIPTTGLTFQYRLKIYEESVSSPTDYPYRNLDYTTMKRSGNVFS